jgi:hypothetical protein
MSVYVSEVEKAWFLFLIRANGYNLLQFAEKCGVPYQVVQQYIVGTNRNSKRTIRICKEFDLLEKNLFTHYAGFLLAKIEELKSVSNSMKSSFPRRKRIAL